MQDFAGDDGRAAALQLLFATPRKWLADGKEIRVERAPTQFGPVSLVVQSHLKEGHVAAELKLPQHMPSKAHLRLRLPDGYRVSGAEANGQKLDVENGETINLASLQGDVTLRVTVTKG